MDIYERIFDLAEEAVNSDSYYIMLDDSTWSDARKMTVANFLEPEATIRQADDETIRDGAGLETNYTYATNESSYYLKNADFVAAAVTPSLKQADNLLDAQLYLLNNKVYLEVIQTLTCSQLLSINSVPVQHIATPGAGFFLNLVDVIGKNNFLTTAYVGGGLALRCDGIELASLSQSLVQATAIYREKGTVATGSGVELTPNKPLMFYAVADYTTGDGTISVRTKYEVVDDTWGTASSALNQCCNIPVTGSFVDADLNGSDQLVINHNYNSALIIGVIVTDPTTNQSELKNFQLGDGNNAFADPNNYITIEFGAPIAAGTWTYYFIVRG